MRCFVMEGPGHMHDFLYSIMKGSAEEVAETDEV